MGRLAPGAGPRDLPRSGSESKHGIPYAPLPFIALTIAPGGAHAVTLAGDGLTRIVSIEPIEWAYGYEDHREAYPLTHVSALLGAARSDLEVARSGRHLALAAEARQVVELDGRTLTVSSFGGGVVRTVTLDVAAACVAPSSDGTTLFAGAASGELQVVRGAAAPERVASPHAGAIVGIALSPDERLLLTGGDDGRVTLWDAVKLEVLGTWCRHGAAARRFAFSSTGGLFLSAGDDGDVTLWRVDPARTPAPRPTVAAWPPPQAPIPHAPGPARLDLTLPRMVRNHPAPQRMPFMILVAGDLAGCATPMPFGDQTPRRCTRGDLAKVRDQLLRAASPAVDRRWQDLAALVSQADATTNVDVEILAVTLDELREDFEDVWELPKSGLYRHLISGEYGGSTGKPFGVVILALPLSGGPAMAALLRKVATVCAQAHATLMLPPSPALGAEPLLGVVEGPLAAHIWVADPLSALAGPIETYGRHDVVSLTDMRLLDAQVARSIRRLNVNRTEPIVPQVQAWLDARTGDDPSHPFREARAELIVPASPLAAGAHAVDRLAIDFVPGPLFPAMRRRVEVAKDRE